MKITHSIAKYAQNSRILQRVWQDANRLSYVYCAEEELPITFDLLQLIFASFKVRIYLEWIDFAMIELGEYFAELQFWL